MDYDKVSFREVEENDIKRIKIILRFYKDKLNYDEEYMGWCIGSERIVDFLYENNETVINPKELEGFIDEFIEEELKIEKIGDE